MKNFLVFAAMLSLVLSSCKTSELTSYTDDIYVMPSEERKLAKIAAEEKAKQVAIEKQKQEDARLAEKARIDANPYYKDPEYNKDDYYDYAYSSRLNRFSSPILGAGYYDPYYTNAYTYNQNPAMYGTSIYSSYNYGMPSMQFGYLSMGFSNSFNSGYGYNNYNNGYYSNNGYGYNNSYWGNNYYTGYNSYGCNNGFGYNPYYSYNVGNYNSYNLGYYNGYNNGWNNAGWGYFNSYDPNSTQSAMQFGVRGSNSGGNSSNNSESGASNSQGNNIRQQFFESVNQQQSSSPRFTEVVRGQRASGSNNNPRFESSNNTNAQQGNYNSGYNAGSPRSTGTGSNRNTEVNNHANNGVDTEIRNNRRNNASPRVSEANNNPVNNSQNSANRSSESWNSNSTNSGGGNSGSSGSSPRGGSGSNSGGGSNRPR